MNLIKHFLGKRQAVRLHIEQMKVTQAAMKERAKNHQHDPLAYETAHNAVLLLEDKIEKAKRELHILERKWSW